MILFSTPCNPTGEVYHEKALKRMAEIARERNIMLVSDEPYHKIIFDQSSHVSPGKFGLQNVAVVNSFSKTYAMSGWRIGYIIAEKYLVEGMKKVQMHQCTSVAPFTQDAAKFALMNDVKGIEERRQIYKKRRDLFVNSVSKSLPGRMPPATFYYFARTDHLGVDGKTLVEKLIEKKMLAVPGYLFGKFAPNAVRFSFAKPEEDLKAGAERVNEVVESLKQH
ncbi:Aromatic-amino-acid aminotransferase 2 [uncultured archaeon]|nr:Aromatic-amino-acid aminotransferase 2 [uncultured archaeon]